MPSLRASCRHPGWRGPGAPALASEQRTAEGFVEGLALAGEECAEERALRRSQDAVPGKRLGERQPDERGEVVVIGERMRQRGQAECGRQDCLEVAGPGS